MLPGFVASGNINPSRFVVLSGQSTVAQAGANAVAIGVSQEGSYTAPVDDAPSLAAIAGLPLKVYGDTETCLVEAGAAFAVNAELKPDAQGRAIAAVATDKYSAVALEPAAAAGVKVRCLIRTSVK
jgi:uncharacterized protein YaiE (UPF0345 family)